ncbi:MAG: hypothetical protein AAGA86_10730, partial [Bacteroidota bacterium]
HTYKKQDDALASIKNPDDPVPALFNRFTLKDVTKEYISVGDIELSNLFELPKHVKYVYLSTYNSGSWKPIFWAKPDKNGKVVFKNMDDNNVLYLPSYFHNGNVLPAGYPFVFKKNHALLFIEKKDSLGNLKLNYFNKLYDETIGDGTLLEGIFEKDIKYSISYWDGYWHPMDTQITNDSIVEFPKVPDNALLRIESPALSNIYQRPFIIENGKQVFL